MYISFSYVKQSLEELMYMHIFCGTTFLVFKQGDLPIGSMIEFPISSKLGKFMDKYYTPYPNSETDYKYYRVYRHTQKDTHWLKRKWPTGTAQSTMTRDFGEAFLHEPKTKLWGWRPEYVEILKHKAMPLVPAFQMAIWLFRDRSWNSDSRPQDVLDTFLKEFKLTDEEIAQLFDVRLPTWITSDSLFQANSIAIEDFRSLVGMPPDAPAEEGGTLAHLKTIGIGPATEIEFNPAARLNLITGDNGLGKSFLLECAWWALTGQWVDPTLPAYPSESTLDIAKIIFRIAGESTLSETFTVPFDRQSLTWPIRSKEQTIPGLIIYARADSSFAIWDPAQHYRSAASVFSMGAFTFTWNAIWNGLEIGEGAKKRYVCNGLIRDWISWQNTPNSGIFKTFVTVLAHLSPQDNDVGILKPGSPTRIPDDSRDIPTIALPYGEIPVVYASEGMRRVMALAYLLVWAWNEHKTQSELAGRLPQQRLVILIDEIEAHLHPKWQRLVVPALLDVQKELDEELSIQFIIATHSPLVMASVEPLFDDEIDKLFHLNLVRAGLFRHEVHLEEHPFIRHGVADSWLTSEVFELGQARSIEAEKAIESAKTLQTSEDPDPKKILAVSQELMAYLSADDAFWPRWLYFAEQYGVEI